MWQYGSHRYKETNSFVFLPQENQNFRLVQTPSALCMACVFQHLLLEALVGVHTDMHIAGLDIFNLILTLYLEVKWI